MTTWMGTNGVVNPDLTVKGTIGLRVVDASVFVSLTPALSDDLYLTPSPLALRPSCPPDVSDLHGLRTRRRSHQGRQHAAVDNLTTSATIERHDS